MRTELSASNEAIDRLPNVRIFVDGPDTASRTLALRMFQAALERNQCHVRLRVIRTDGERVLTVEGRPRSDGSPLPRIELVTAPGAAASSASRRLLLMSADGVLFLSGDRASNDVVLTRARSRLEQQLTQSGADAVLVLGYEEGSDAKTRGPATPEELVEWIKRLLVARAANPRQIPRAPLVHDRQLAGWALLLLAVIATVLWTVIAISL